MSESQFDTLNFNETFKKTDSLGRAALFLASWFFTGLMPKAPGTVGTLAAIPIALAIHFLGAVKGGVCLLCLISVAVLTSDLSRKLLGSRLFSGPFPFISILVKPHFGVSPVSAF